FLGSFSVKTPFCRSRALELVVTACDQRLRPFVPFRLFVAFLVRGAIVILQPSQRRLLEHQSCTLDGSSVRFWSAPSLSERLLSQRRSAWRSLRSITPHRRARRSSAGCLRNSASLMTSTS